MTNLIAGLLMPLPVILLLLALGLLLQLLAHRVAGFLLLLLATGALCALALPGVPEQLLEPLEAEYPPLVEPPDAAWILVLGGGAYEASDRPTTGRLSESSLARVVEAVRLSRLLPGARVVLSGADSAEAMAEAAWGLGLAMDTVEVFPDAGNTAAEAHAAAERVGSGVPIILVTSAFHMPRAVALFERHGLTVVPAPAGHLVAPAQGAPLSSRLPQAEYLRYSERALWERLALFWGRLVGEL